MIQTHSSFFSSRSNVRFFFRIGRITCQSSYQTQISTTLDFDFILSLAYQRIAAEQRSVDKDAHKRQYYY
jgi:hypothetical protein